MRLSASVLTWDMGLIRLLQGLAVCAVILVPAMSAMPSFAQAQDSIDVRVSSGTDDAEERSSGTSTSSSDLELTVDKDVNQIVGMRFNNVAIPRGALISNAYIQFQVDETGSTLTTLNIQGELTGNAGGFSSAAGNISSRLRTSASVPWTPPAWSSTGSAGPDQMTPDIGAVIQEIVSQGGWSRNNSLVVIITGDGNGKRVAESYNGSADGAPLLHVEFSTIPITPGNEAPLADAGPDRTLMLPVDAACLAGTASDDGIPGGLSSSWTQAGGPAAEFDNASALSTTVSFFEPGIHTFRFRVSDGELATSDDVTVTVSDRIDVPGDAPTIQAGVDLANDGDTILVAPGTYNEVVVIAGKSVTLASHYLLTGDPAYIANTIIDGGDALAAVDVLSSVGPTTTIIGFTIQNALDGIQTSAPINIFYNRLTANFDGIEYENGSGGVARGNLLEFNIDDGIDINRNVSVTVEENVIRENGGDGMELRLNAYSGPLLVYTIRNNLIYNNEDDGIQLIDYDDTSDRVFYIERNVIVGNWQAGLGIMGGGNTHENYEGYSMPEPIFLTNNTFVGNSHGVTGGDNLIARNNIFADHSVLAVKNIDGGSSVTHSIFWNNGTDIESSNVDPATTWYLDPSLDTNYHPLSSSSAIDAGVDVGFPFNGIAPDLGAFETPVNTAPTVNAGVDQIIWSPTDTVNLEGTVTDDGLPPPPGSLAINWVQLAGRCGVIFGDATAPDSSATVPQLGIYTLRLSASDGQFTESDDVTIEYTGDPIPNRPPVANDDTADTTLAVPVTVNAASNDSDPDGNLDLTSANTDCTSCSIPVNGTLINNGDGSFEYLPIAVFLGDDGFVYEICDTDGLCDTATVTVTVSDTDRPPVANDDNASTTEDTAVTIDVAANDTDPDGNLDPTSANTTCPGCTVPSNGGLVNNADGSFEYTPNPGFNGPDSFVYEICDTDPTCDTAVVSITVTPTNDPPFATTDSASTPEDTAVTIDVAANDTDPDGNLDLASANTTCPGCAVPADGALTDNGDGSFTYTPNLDFNGTDGFVYEICDTLGACDTAAVSITVTPTDDPPVANDDNADTTEDTAVTIDVAANDTDPDGNLDPASANTACPGCAMPSNGGLVNNADGTFEYTPNPGFNGPDSLVYEICDSGSPSLCDSATVAITVNSSAPVTVEIRVVASSDDAEEKASGSVTLVSSDLEMVFDKSIKQTVGIRFTGVSVPNGATILSASIQFEADEVSTEPTSLIIEGEATDDAVTFQKVSRNITARVRTGQSIAWDPAPWNTRGEAGPDQQTPDLSFIIQEIINRPGWAAGNALVVIITGTGTRTAESFNGTAPPIFQIEYQTGGPSMNLPPVVDAGPDATVITDSALTLNGFVSDDGLPALPGATQVLWTQVSGPGTVTFTDAASAQTSATFSDPGTYVVRLTADDSEFTRFDETTITAIAPGGPFTLDIPVAASSDDAEERASGSVKLTSSDLELVFDKSTEQTVGIRFTGVSVPNGATILNASIQFETDEVSTDPTSLVIEGEAIDDAVTFRNVSRNITDRVRTGQSIAWDPAPWNTRGVAGPDQQTPDLSSIIQEIINRPGWAAGNAVVVIITGTGARIAESFNGTAPAILHIEYQAG